MDRREMKKKILYFALSDLQTSIRDGGAFYQFATDMLDKEVENVTDAEYRRFLDVLQQMVENAESKLK